MQKQVNNPRFTPFFRIVTYAELCVVGLAGVGLFFLTDIGRTQWPWHILPFNSLFLGAAYLSSLATMLIMLVGGRWAPARVGLWMLAGFTVPILFFSLIYLDHFDFQRIATWVWYFLFITIAPYSVYNIWLHRNLAPGNPITLPSLWRSYLLLQGILLGLYALALLLAPNLFTGFWPWKIDEFHGRVYCAIFLTGAAGSFALWQSAALVEVLMLAMTQIVLGLFAILGLIIADISQHRVHWSALTTWLWIAIFTWLFLVGVGLIWFAVANQMRERSSRGTA